MAAKKRSFSPEFKAKVVIETLKEEDTLAQVAGKYGLNPQVLARWRKEFLEHPERVFDEQRRKAEQKRKEEALEEERDRLLRKVGELTLECDYLQRSCEKLGIDPGEARGR